MSRSDTFLFELYTEEIPSFYQKKLIESWNARLENLLNENFLEFSGIEVGGTSRRIYILIYELMEKQATQKKKLKGPPREVCLKNNQPTNALTGFAKKAGVSVEDVRFEDIDGGSYAVADSEVGGKNIGEILPAVFENLIKFHSFPRSMRWADLTISYARPVIHYVSIYGSNPMPFNSGIWDIFEFSQKPAGHFILSPGYLDLKTASEYASLLQQKGIIVNPVNRRQEIIRMLKEAAGEEKPILNDNLLDEVNFLVECPVVIRGSFPHEFLQMPEVVIISEMEEHQKYFGLRKTTGKLSQDFLIVANANKDDREALENIRRGNEKVLRARLSDGSYFFHEDRKKKLKDRVDDLKRIVFHEGMGSLFDKKERIKKIAQILANYVYPEVESDKLLRACDLIKADLTTHLVYEFDHLQGEIGSIYASMDGEDEEISCAIFEHYLPRNTNDSFPESRMGFLLSISDKMDNIISGHILGKQPTASQDPLGLRRQTLYIIDMLIQNKITLSLNQIFLEFLLKVYNIHDDQKRFKLTNEIVDFFTGRMATIFEKEEFDKKLINAILNTGGDQIYTKFLQLDSLRSLKKDENFLLMLAAFKRMNNIVKDFLVKNTGATITSAVNENIFVLPQEKRLFEITNKVMEMISKVTGTDRLEYENIFKYIASVKTDVDDFFDHVMVMHDDEKIRINRLAILSGAVTAIGGLINIEMLQ